MRSGPRRWRRRLLTALSGVLGVAVVAGVISLVWLQTLPSVDDAEARVAAILKVHGGRDSGEPANQRLVTAIVDVEDQRFYSHHGIDVVGVVRAGWATLLRQPGDHGGSTITQQLANVLYGQDGGSTIDDVGLAIKLDHAYSKAQILEMYVNSVYFGLGQYGVVGASAAYFHTDPAQLSWSQAALLAGVLQSPTGYDPSVHPAAAMTRRSYVLRQLVDHGHLSAEEAAAGGVSPLLALAPTHAEAARPPTSSPP